MVALLNEIEVSKVELTATRRIGRPGIEISFVRQIVVDKTGKNAGDEGVAVAVTLKVVLNGLRIASYFTGPKKSFSIRWEKTREGLAPNARDRLARRIEKYAGN